MNQSKFSQTTSNADLPHQI